jgi:hypothetical protein
MTHTILTLFSFISVFSFFFLSLFFFSLLLLAHSYAVLDRFERELVKDQDREYQEVEYTIHLQYFLLDKDSIYDICALETKVNHRSVSHN